MYMKIKSIYILIILTSTLYSQNNEWVYLFDGKTFNGWHQYNKEKMSV